MSTSTVSSRINPWWIAPLIVVFSIIALAWQRAEIPERGDWRAAIEMITPRLEDGDGIAWTPYWASEGRLFLHGLPGFHLPDVHEADLSRWKRVWLLGAFGYDADDLPDGHRVIERQTFGQVTVDLIEVKGDRVVGDLRADLEAARVAHIDRKGARKACDFWDGRGWHCRLRKSPDVTRKCLARPTSRRLSQRRRDPHCGLDPWLNVSRDVRVIGDFPRRCVWFHPVKGKTLQLTWPDAPAGDVVVSAGFTDKVITDHTRKEVRTRPAKLTVRRGEAELGAIDVPAEKGWMSWRSATSATGPLIIEAVGESQVDAHLCIDVTVRTGGSK